MEGTFLGTYDNKINKLDNLINQCTDPIQKKKYETELNDYILKCIPYINKYTSSESEQTEEVVDPIFNTITKKGIQRREIYEDYMKNVEDYTGSFNNPQRGYKFKNLFFTESCKNCNSKNMIQDDQASLYICTDCGVCETFLGEELTYKEEQELNEKTIINCGYKKENHLNEWILQFQGRETTNIPNEVLDKLRTEFKKQKIKKVQEITKEKVKQYLKKLKLTKYYEHSTHITHLLSGIKPPEMSQELEDRLRHMFREIQDPFVKHCPKDRNNFLSYSYVLYKFCELLGEDQYLPFFPLLKSKEKLRQQDVIWKKICNEVRWEYISTI